MTTEEEIKQGMEQLGELNPEALLADGFEAAFIGIGQQFNKYLAVYDYKKCAEVLMDQGMSYEEATEFLDFNTTGAWAGEGTPIFLHALPFGEMF